MAGNKQILETEARERLKEYTSQLFDDEPAGAIDRSIKFFDEFLSRVRKRRSELEGQIDHYEKERQQHHQKIKERRGSYFSAAQTFGNRPLIPGLAMIIAFLMIFGYTYLFLDSKLDRSLEAVIVIGAGVVAIALVAWSAYTWVGSTKTSFIQRYNFRLQTHRLLEQARLEADVLKSIETYALDIQREISGFRDEIVKLRALAQARWEHEQAWEQLLYEHPYFGLEKSVIDQADVEMYYNEVAGEYSKRHLAKLFGDSYEGNYQSWLKQWAEQELNAEQMWERLYRYCTDQAEVLKQHYIVGKIEKQKSYEQSQVREDIEEIKKHARPFLRTRLRGDLGEDSETPLRESVAVHFERDEEADIVQGANKVATALHSLQLLPNVDDFGERYRLSVVTARRGLPLYILPDVMNCRPSYRQARDLHLVHTTKGNIALPDLAESHVSPAQFDDLPFNLEPRQAIALAAAFNQFAPEAFEALHYQDAQASSSDNEQVSAAGYYLVYVDARQREIANQLGREPKKTFHYLGSGKAQACLALYTDQNVLAHLRAGIHDYLVGQRDLSPLTGELLDYIEHGKRPDPHKPENILQDWEVIELERALDILLAHLRPASVDA